MNDKLKVQEGRVVSVEYTLEVDGKIVDSSEEGKPAQFVTGTGNVIPGLERGMAGMTVGENKTLVVEPQDGYGEVEQSNFQEIPSNRFPKDVELKPGVQLKVNDKAGGTKYARIDRVQGDTVRLDFNHPLAGKQLHFDVKVVGLRDATQSEMAQGRIQR